MNTQTKSSTKILAAEVAQIQSKLPKLQLKRQKLAQFPSLRPDASPDAVAQKIATSVTSNASKIRGLDAAIATLAEDLAAKQRQLAKTQVAERKQSATLQLEKLHQEAISRGEAAPISRPLQSQTLKAWTLLVPKRSYALHNRISDRPISELLLYWQCFRPRSGGGMEA